MSTERKVCNKSLKIKVKMRLNKCMIFSIGIYIMVILLRKVENFENRTMSMTMYTLRTRTRTATTVMM